MTKTIRVNMGLMILLMSLNVSAGDDLSRTEESHATRINKACDLKIRFDLHDFEYGRDEKSEFSNNHFEPTSLLSGLIEEACKINPVNRKKLERVGTIIIKRGSMEERKLLQKKNGDLVYLVSRVKAEQSKNKDDLIQADLVRVLGLTYEKPAEKVKVKEKKSEVPASKTGADRDKKIADLTAWFQGEVAKAQSLPPAQMGPAMEKLSKTYEEKLNALINTP